MKRGSQSVIFFLLIFFIAYAAHADTGLEPKDAFGAVKTALSKSRMSKGPDASKATRSVWGPGLYRSNVNATVLVVIVEKDKDGEFQPVGQGSGVVVSQNGTILTNWHVVWPHPYVVVFFYPGPNSDFSEISEKDVWIGRVGKLDKTRDLALIELLLPKDKSLPSEMKSIVLEDPIRIEVGQDVFAIGHPKGLQWTYTEGVISQIRPRYKWQDEEGGEHRATMIQTQTAINPGSSGGPLIDRDGKLIGIIQGMHEGAGLNFAISVHELRSFLAK